MVQRWLPSVEEIPEGTTVGAGDERVRSEGLLHDAQVFALNCLAGVLVASPYLVMLYLVYVLSLA